MTDSQFTMLIQRTARAYNKYKPLLDKAEAEYIRRYGCAYNKYKPLLDKAEAEYIRRYGCAPGDHDDDFWIDSLHGAGGATDERLTAEQVHEAALMCVG